MTKTFYDVVWYDVIVEALYIVPASAVRKMYPLYDEMNATVEDTDKKE